jgi:S-adenosylmethionine-diacylglycerol 3-amino-3-carboxypropyl transferase
MKLSNRHFFSRLSYSFGNEDASTERKALDCKKNDRILCITASGDRPLHLLLDDCHEIVTIDLNEMQNHLLALKVQAMQQFDYEHYLSFLGGMEDTHRVAKLQLLLPHLDEKEKQFWTRHEKLVSKGVIYQGAIERLCKRVASVLRIVRKQKVKRLFEFENIEEQKQFIKEHWNNYFWQKSFNFFFQFSIHAFGS